MLFYNGFHKLKYFRVQGKSLGILLQANRISERKQENWKLKSDYN